MGLDNSIEENVDAARCAANRVADAHEKAKGLPRSRDGVHTACQEVQSKQVGAGAAWTNDVGVVPRTHDDPMPA